MGCLTRNPPAAELRMEALLHLPRHVQGAGQGTARVAGQVKACWVWQGQCQQGNARFSSPAATSGVQLTWCLNLFMHNFAQLCCFSKQNCVIKFCLIEFAVRLCSIAATVFWHVRA
jgi:hypothetical protein